MSQAFYTAVGGLNAAQTQINVISDNIANMNTIGFKESTLTFENIFSNTLSSGSAPTTTSGGKNPMQIGMGVKVSSIAKNFLSGTVQSTGKTTDLNIQGNGYFTIMNSSGEIFYTKAGNFNLDPEGNLSFPNGQKVLGTSATFNLTGSNTPIKIPTRISVATSPNTNNLASKELSKLNDCSIIPGDFHIDVTYKDYNGDTQLLPVTVTLDESDKDLNAIKNKITSALQSAVIPGDGTSTNPDTAFDADEIVITCDNTTDGTFKISFNDSGANSISKLQFRSGSSNFISETQLATAPLEAGNTYSSKVLDYRQTIGPADSLETAKTLSTYAITDEGAIVATYSNGDKLTVVTNPEDSTRTFEYTTSNGIVITGNEDIDIKGGIVTPANLQLQLAKVVNDNGLISRGSNLFSLGANTGDVTYSIGDNNGFGTIKSGGLESSNVDLSKQFADMILAQRYMEANSRVFDGANTIMKTLTNMGR